MLKPKPGRTEASMAVHPGWWSGCRRISPGRLALVNCCRRDPESTAPASWHEAIWNEKALASYRFLHKTVRATP
jgi:hypothetical protein